MELLQHRHALCWQLENRRVHLAGVKESHTSAGADLARVQAEVFDSYTWQTTCLDTLQTRVEKYHPILRSFIHCFIHSFIHSFITNELVIGLWLKFWAKCYS